MDRSILDEAYKLVSDDRSEEYGGVLESFKKISGLWSPILGVAVTPLQVALCMIELKVAREAHKHKRDNLIDIIGYVLTIVDMYEEKELKNDV